MLLVVVEGMGDDGSRRMGIRRGIRNRERPLEPSVGDPVRASAMEMSLSVAEENHLNPSM